MKQLTEQAGCGLVQSWKGRIEKIRPGDVIWSAPTTAMTHISIVEQLDGKSADWMEHVSDEEYQAPGGAE